MCAMKYFSRKIFAPGNILETRSWTTFNIVMKKLAIVVDNGHEERLLFAGPASND